MHNEGGYPPRVQCKEGLLLILSPGDGKDGRDRKSGPPGEEPDPGLSPTESEYEDEKQGGDRWSRRCGLKLRLFGGFRIVLPVDASNEM